MNKFKFIYDKDVDSLTIYKENRKTHWSIRFGDMIIDLDKNYNISAIEILNPDSLFQIPKKLLNQISSVSLKVYNRGNILVMLILLRFKSVEEASKLLLPLPLEKPIKIKV